MERLAETNCATLGVGVGAVLVILFWPRLAPKVLTRLLPGSILAMLLVSGLVVGLGWDRSLGVATVGSQFGPEAIPAWFPGRQRPEVSFRLLGEWHELARRHRMPASDALVLPTTLRLTIVFDLVIAVEVGMVLAAILFTARVAETIEVNRFTGDDMLERSEQVAQGKKIPEGVLVYRMFGPFLFGATEKMEDDFSSLGALPKVLILRLHLVTAMDATGLNVLQSIVERLQQRSRQIILFFITLVQNRKNLRG